MAYTFQKEVLAGIIGTSSLLSPSFVCLMSGFIILNDIRLFNGFNKNSNSGFYLPGMKQSAVPEPTQLNICQLIASQGYIITPFGHILQNKFLFYILQCTDPTYSNLLDYPFAKIK